MTYLWAEYFLFPIRDRWDNFKTLNKAVCPQWQNKILVFERTSRYIYMDCLK